MNSNTAAALNYGIFRRKDFNETAHNILFYDMGASSTVATVASYQVVKIKEKGYTEQHPQVSVLGLGYDRTLGGLEIQVRLRDHLARAFNKMKKTKNDVTTNQRAMAKLFKEAGRVKNVLSANVDHYAQIENLMDEQDFRLQVTRDDLESLSADLLERVPGPIERALASSKLTLDQISHIIIVGAATRMPKIQEILTKFTQRELGKNLNADEAAALGAVYRAADLSTGFKVKKFLTKDAVIFPVEVLYRLAKSFKYFILTFALMDDKVDFERELDPDEEGRKVIKVIKRTLFPLMNPYPQKKVLTFNKHNEDFSFYVNYGDLSAALPAAEVAALGSAPNLTRVDLNGVADALARHVGDGTEFKGIKAHFAIDDSGLLSLGTVENTFERIVLPAVADEESASTNGTDSEEGAANSSTKTNATTAPKEKKPKVEIIKEDIAKKETCLDLNDLAGDQFQVAHKR